VGVGICDEWCGWENICYLPFQGSKDKLQSRYDLSPELSPGNENFYCVHVCVCVCVCVYVFLCVSESVIRVMNNHRAS